MKELKFRAWDKLHKQMEFIEDFYWFEESGVHDSGGFGHHANYVLMQSTGIKDINGIEIYESDILKITCNFELRKGIEIDEVVWWEDGAWSCSDWCLFELVRNGAKGEQRFEIIGNKYENPELIKY